MSRKRKIYSISLTQPVAAKICKKKPTISLDKNIIIDFNLGHWANIVKVSKNINQNYDIKVPLIKFVFIIIIMNAKNYYKRGRSKSKSNDYTGAIEDFNKVIELEPHYPNVYYTRGFCKSKLGHNKDAIQDFNKAIEEEPAYTHVYYSRGISKSILGDSQQAAIEDFNTAISLNPDSANAYYSRGFCK
ncbi:MAG: tetratricopeptide repeat protein, partial [Bacteroidetes bacterium]|nr:tetratricopeptide repeat protein [Bacteroidota bacterium]